MNAKRLKGNQYYRNETSGCTEKLAYYVRKKFKKF